MNENQINLSNTYFISDIHGEYDKFKKLLEYIEYDESKNLFILGDLCDRGEKTKEVIEYILTLPNVKMILGNHDYFMIKSLESMDYTVNWLSIGYGGNATLRSYNYNLNDYLKNYTTEYKNHCELLNKMFYYYEEFDSLVMVHAGVNPNRNIEEGQGLNDILFIREEFYNHEEPMKNKVIMFGHTPTNFIDNNDKDEIYVDDRKIGIDTGAVFGGKMSLIKFNKYSLDEKDIEVIYIDKDMNIGKYNKYKKFGGDVITQYGP
jgi:serine/threonine protein phosphatase 1